MDYEAKVPIPFSYPFTPEHHQQHTTTHTTEEHSTHIHPESVDLLHHEEDEHLHGVHSSSSGFGQHPSSAHVVHDIAIEQEQHHDLQHHHQTEHGDHQHQDGVDVHVEEKHIHYHSADGEHDTHTQEVTKVIHQQQHQHQQQQQHEIQHQQHHELQQLQQHQQQVHQQHQQQQHVQQHQHVQHQHHGLHGGVKGAVHAALHSGHHHAQTHGHTDIYGQHQHHSRLIHNPISQLAYKVGHKVGHGLGHLVGKHHHEDGRPYTGTTKSSDSSDSSDSSKTTKVKEHHHHHILPFGSHGHAHQGQHQQHQQQHTIEFHPIAKPLVHSTHTIVEGHYTVDKAPQHQQQQQHHHHHEVQLAPYSQPSPPQPPHQPLEIHAHSHSHPSPDPIVIEKKHIIHHHHQPQHHHTKEVHIIKPQLAPPTAVVHLHNHSRQKDVKLREIFATDKSLLHHSSSAQLQHSNSNNSTRSSASSKASTSSSSSTGKATTTSTKKNKMARHGDYYDEEYAHSSTSHEQTYKPSHEKVKSSHISSVHSANKATFTIPCHHIRIGDLVILQHRPCQIIRITTSAQTGQHRYLGVDLFTKQLHEEPCVVSHPSPSVVLHSLLGPVFKQYRLIDIRDDGKLVAMTESGEIKQGLKVVDQGNLWNKLREAFGKGSGSVRILVISDAGKELAVDYKIVHLAHKL